MTTMPQPFDSAGSVAAAPSGNARESGGDGCLGETLVEISATNPAAGGKGSTGSKIGVSESSTAAASHRTGSGVAVGGTERRRLDWRLGVLGLVLGVV